MLFNSTIFMAGFLPVVFLGFLGLAQAGRRRAAAAWLTLASLVFYGWYDPSAVVLILVSIGVNFAVGSLLIRRRSGLLLAAGLVFNLALLGWYKYATFVIGEVDAAFGLDWTVPMVVLPLAISFYTFQQIAWLMDCSAGEVEQPDLLDYALFVTFFPQLIAGPITHHREMMGQFRDPALFRPTWTGAAVGVTLFLAGLFKKVVLADPLGADVAPVFAAAAEGAAPAFLDAWGAAVGYTLQIYFDFSGYSEMAIGLALLFGISLPANFDSPFKARNVIDYWSRWHMTLTRFLTAYVYNPLVMRLTRARAAAGKPLPRRGRMPLGAFLALVAFPTMVTLFVSGVWHGAGWQFVVFGLLHGAYLTVAHGFRALKARAGLAVDSPKAWHVVPAVLLTFLCVVVAMVFFRAPSVPAALAVLEAMAGLGTGAETALHYGRNDAIQILVLLGVVWFLPNVLELLARYRTAVGWRPRPAGFVTRLVPTGALVLRPAQGAIVGLVGAYALALALSRAPTEFLYFQF